MESLSTTVLGSDFHTDGAEQRKARFASVVLDDDWDSNVVMMNKAIWRLYTLPPATFALRLIYHQPSFRTECNLYHAPGVLACVRHCCSSDTSPLDLQYENIDVIRKTRSTQSISHNTTRGALSHGHRQHAQKICEILHVVKRHVSGQTDRHARHNTPLPYRDRVTNKCLIQMTGPTHKTMFSVIFAFKPQ